MRGWKFLLPAVFVLGSGLVSAETPIAEEATSGSAFESSPDSSAAAVEPATGAPGDGVDDADQADWDPAEPSSESRETVSPEAPATFETDSDPALESPTGSVPVKTEISISEEGVSDGSGQPDSLLQLRGALETPADVYGIPEGLYPLDDKLRRYRRSIQAKMESNRRTGVGIIAVGGVGLALSGILAAIAADNARAAEELRNSPGYVVIEDPSAEQYTYAVINGIFSLGAIIYGASLLNRKPNTDYLHQYYKKKYGPHLSRDLRNGPYLAMDANGVWKWGYRLAW